MLKSFSAAEMALRVYAVASDTAAVQLQNPSTNKTRCYDGVFVTALAANSAPVYLGGSGVTTANGLELKAGETKFFEVDPADIWVVSAAAQGVRVFIT